MSRPDQTSPGTSTNACPCCGQEATELLCEVEGIPVHSVLLMPTREKAIGYPRGDLRLRFCAGCGHVFNAAFDPSRLDYGADCEESQGCSPTFDAFQNALAERLITAHDLQGRRILEIGCGKGEFLALLCHLGGNSGVGYDPAYLPGRFSPSSSDDIRFVDRFYDGTTEVGAADFVCCKMTLEHVKDPRLLVRAMRHALGDGPRGVAFVQVPDVARILEETAFWDLYYEHCGYFSVPSLTRLFESAGFVVTDVTTEYAGQYITVTAAVGETGSRQAGEWTDVGTMGETARSFSADLPRSIASWQRRFREWRARGDRIALWGGGSKAVSLVTMLGVTAEVAAVVDINPQRQGTFLAGGGQPIIGPDDLSRLAPDRVVVMNPVYRDEIAAAMAQRGIRAEIIILEAAHGR